MIQIQRITTMLISLIFLILMVFAWDWFSPLSQAILWGIVLVALVISMFCWHYGGRRNPLLRYPSAILLMLYFLFSAYFVYETGGVYSQYFPLLFIFPLTYSAMMSHWGWFLAVNFSGMIYTIYLFITTGDPSTSWLNFHILLQYSVIFTVSGLLLYFNSPCLHCHTPKDCGKHINCPVELIEDLQEGREH
ncbi:hypothetical protein [Rubeoparvulum massiliense]|uniref:hypothetical protein n=1 Tax=Rubeoparvulum massiliense TaxID=1631346 RepID=UPI00065E4B39|nr:hypothetical protein [Rubeoparvulum massiliense]